MGDAAALSVPSATYEAVFGALSAVPLILAWLYVCWAVLLLGAALILALPVALHAADEEAIGTQEWHLPSPDEKVVLTIRLGEDGQGTTRLP